jgi:tRNA U34 5-methylaminomethyl-2-thiouridine-forming methyltransferase MnmC
LGKARNSMLDEVIALICKIEAHLLDGFEPVRPPI